jgi:glyoxylase-like metal-dependent hydrolase (beta-lactamase superfamily II)
VKTIVLTHMHIDHDGGLADFAHARVWAAAGEIAATRGLAGRVRGYLPQRWPSGFDPQPIHFADKPFGPFARSRPLTVDGAVVALPTPGHTPHHLCVALVDDDVTLVFAGDASYSQANLVARRIDGISEDEAVAGATLDRLNGLAAERPVVFLPAHDPEAADRLARRQTAPSPRMAA